MYIMKYSTNHLHFVDMLGCSNVSTTIDPFWDISLDLGPTEAETGLSTSCSLLVSHLCHALQ